MNEEFKLLRKKYQGKYFSYSNEVSWQYCYIRKIINFSYYVNDKIVFLIADYIYIPVEGKPAFWENDKHNTSENFLKKHSRISKSDFNNILKRYGIERIHKEISG